MPQKSKINMQIWLLALASSVLLSVPYIVPHCGLVSLVAFIPLFAAEQIAFNNGKKHFFHIFIYKKETILLYVLSYSIIVVKFNIDTHFYSYKSMKFLSNIKISSYYCCLSRCSCINN